MVSERAGVELIIIDLTTNYNLTKLTRWLELAQHRA